MKVNKVICLMLSSMFILDVAANQPKPNENLLIQQEERSKEMERMLLGEQPDVRLSSPDGKKETFSLQDIPHEEVCFTINKVEITGVSDFTSPRAFYDLVRVVEGQCLGQNGLFDFIKAIQNRLIHNGYVTSRVEVPDQDLKSRTLKLHVVKGVVESISLDKPQYVQLGNAFLIRDGAVLSLRDLEQGLENLKRVPTVDAQISLYPGEQTGGSRVVVSRIQEKPWRLNLSFDDSGTKATGRYQGALTLFLDNPLGLSDLFYLSLGKDTHNKSTYDSKNYALHYSVPFGYWALSASYYRTSYLQQIAVTPEVSFPYSGAGRYGYWQISRVIQRNGNQKTTLNYTLLTRDTRNYIIDFETQRRQTTAWRLGIDHRYYMLNGTLDFGINYQNGTRWLNALPAPEEKVGEGTGLGKMLNVSTTLNKSFLMGKEVFHYRGNYRYQYNFNRLTDPDKFSIGGRWSVRGFDGQSSLSGDMGWYAQNTLTWVEAIKKQNLYVGVDFGFVGPYRDMDNRQTGRLVGGVLGVNGSIGRLYYDVFAGSPLSKPNDFNTSSAVLGFNLMWQY